jgi:DNA-binding MarR family transcriptional regulator
VLCRITPHGEALLAQLDPAMDAADTEVMSVLAPEQLADFIELLASVRTGGG